jgi:hypothetical protein
MPMPEKIGRVRNTFSPSTGIAKSPSAQSPFPALASAPEVQRNSPSQGRRQLVAAKISLTLAAFNERVRKMKTCALQTVAGEAV